MDLAELLSEFQPPGVGSWVDAVDEMMRFDPERRRVVELAVELEDHGRFDEPVRLARADIDDDRPARVANGMHRVCAHILTCRPDVSVSYSGPAARAGAELEFTWHLDCATIGGQLDGLLDELGSLGSFRLDENSWLECDGFAVHDRLLSTVADGVPEASAGKALEKLSGRLVAAGLNIDHGTVEVLH